MEQELTEWFPEDVKPNFIGVYEVKPLYKGESGTYAYWAGEGWLPYHCSVYDAYENRNYDPLSRHQDKVWRGLARPIE